jgi:AAA+ superfamily predicted ATPase
LWESSSIFLNELDGIADNIGIVTLATTNHPERLDLSIVDRPSRFDRKYPFDLPELPERTLREQMVSAQALAAQPVPEEPPTMIGPWGAMRIRR